MFSKMVAVTAGALIGLPAVPAMAASQPLALTATDIVYGQPDLNGVRYATNTVTIRNTTAGTIDYPAVTFPVNGRDAAMHGDWADCPGGSGTATSVTCVAAPLAAGGQRTLTFGWSTRSRGPAGRATAVAQIATDPAGQPPEAGLPARVTWRVSFAQLTGGFDITATDLTFGPRDHNGVRHASTTVTVTNLSKATVSFPVVTFAPYDGDATASAWNRCVTVHAGDADVCVEKPLAPGQRRSMTFRFELAGPLSQDYAGQVQVESGADASGAVIPGAAAGTQFTISSPGDML